MRLYDIIVGKKHKIKWLFHSVGYTVSQLEMLVHIVPKNLAKYIINGVHTHNRDATLTLRSTLKQADVTLTLFVRYSIIYLSIRTPSFC